MAKTKFAVSICPAAGQDFFQNTPCPAVENIHSKYIEYCPNQQRNATKCLPCFSPQCVFLFILKLKLPKNKSVFKSSDLQDGGPHNGCASKTHFHVKACAL